MTPNDLSADNLKFSFFIFPFSIVRRAGHSQVNSDSSTRFYAPSADEAAPAPHAASAAAAPAASPHRTCRNWERPPGAGPGARLRVGLILGTVLLLYCGLSARLVQIQVAQAESWKRKAERQQLVREPVLPMRGWLSERTGLPLAYCLPRETVIADLMLLRDREAAAAALSPLLKIPAPVLREKIGRDDRRVVYLSRNVEQDLADKIRALKIRGIGFEDAFKRTYPQGSLASHVIGWYGADAGMEGIELELNGLLAGTPGYLRHYHDAARRRIALNDSALGTENRPPRDGLAVTLTIDARIQQAAEEELARVQQQYQPAASTCIVMDPNTGAILALACLPQYDPNAPAQSNPASRRNRAICDSYEPGSTLKVFTAAMCLERKLWRRDEKIDCENGAWHLGYRTLHDSHAYGLLSFEDGIVKSSNIAAAKMAQRLGVPGLFEAMCLFGFGAQTGINLPGEVKGRLRPREKWTKDSVYSVAMGHEIAVTPIQLVTAYAALVNGGILLRPKIVQSIVNEKDEELYTLRPQVVRRAISEQTSRQMREILARVTLPGGTGTKAYCAEWAIGGKTGTTKKIDPVTHTYSNTLYVASFCGFAPADNPRLVCLVTVDEPRKSDGYYGGTVACPAVREVLRKGLSVLNVPQRCADKLVQSSGF